MNLQLVQIFSGPVTAVIATWLAHQFSSGQAATDGARNMRTAAASDLYLPLRELQSMLRKNGRIEISAAEVAYAFRSFFDAFDRQRHRLPERWGHLGRSIRAAAGTALGGVSFVDLDPSAEFLELAEPHGMWRDFADDYIDYVVNQLMVWGDSVKRGRNELLAFDPWLQCTGRQDPIAPTR